MDIRTLQVDGIGPAIFAMRHPMQSYDRSDTHQGKVGEADKKLSMKLANSGPEHAKHLRMCIAWVEITAPRYWWTEFDTYRAGVEKISCSTMHKLIAKPLTLDDFEIDRCHAAMGNVVMGLNWLMEQYKAETDQEERNAIWREIIQLLPQSYLQRRTVMVSYAALRNMYQQRQGHKLKEWQMFREWCETLPESWMITV